MQGSLEITELVPHPLMEVIFLLEYVVGWSRVAMLNSAPDTPTRRAVANTSGNKNKVSVKSQYLCVEVKILRDPLGPINPLQRTWRKYSLCWLRF